MAEKGWYDPEQGKMVWVKVPDTDVGPSNAIPTRDHARRQLRGAGIHPYPENIDSYVRERSLSNREKEIHTAKITAKSLKQRLLDEKAQHAVEVKEKPTHYSREERGATFDD